MTCMLGIHIDQSPSQSLEPGAPTTVVALPVRLKLGEPCDDLAQPGDSRLLLTSLIRDCRFDSSFLSLLLTPKGTVKAKHVCFIRGSSDLVVGRSHMVSCASLRDPIKLTFVGKIRISCIGVFCFRNTLPRHAR